MREDILHYYQDVTRKRGYPPFPVETAGAFDLDMQDAAKEDEQVRAHIVRQSCAVELPRQNDPAVVNANLPPLTPPAARKKVDLKPFTGRNGWPDRRDRMTYWQVCQRLVYVRGSVDNVFHDEQIALTPETKDWFYSADAVRLPRYVRGTRRLLEQAVREQTAGCESDRARAMALVRLIGNPETSPYRHRGDDFAQFLGGTEDEVLRKGWRMCNEISRVLAFLCQIAGMPARCLFCFTDPLTGVASHSMTEIFFDGKWNMVEQNDGIMYLRKDGYFASAVELRDDPGILAGRADLGGRLGLCHCAFTGPIGIIPYEIDRVDSYQYPWQVFKYV